MKQGNIILINGTSSSGKTSILKSLQVTMTEPYLEAGIDKFIWMLPDRYLDRPLWDDVLGLAVTAGQTGRTLLSGMHQAVAALARSGNYVIMDHVLVEPTWIEECLDLFSGITTWLVGIHCPLITLIEREASRRNRTPGQAAAQFPLVHRGMIYDIEVDTSILTSAECAERIKQRIELAEPPAAINLMRRKYHLNSIAE